MLEVRSIRRRRAVGTASRPWCRDFDLLWRLMPGSKTGEGLEANALRLCSPGLVALSVWRII